jgi:hypothetical protein
MKLNMSSEQILLERNVTAPVSLYKMDLRRYQIFGPG